MRKAIVTLIVVGCSFGGIPAGPAKADSCHGDLYCDELPAPCEMGGLLYPCSAGDATVDMTRP